MGNKQKNNSLTKRFAALGLTLAMIIPMVGYLGINADAATTSLTGIENLKNSKRHLNILEIVPQENTGSVGYYMDGEEPISNWLETMAATAGTTGREDYANNTLFKSLQDRGLMGTATGTDSAAFPLTYQGAYDEIMPWELTTSNVATVEILNLLQVEEKAVKGEIALSETGDYIKDPSFVFVANGSGATHVENAQHYFYGEPGEGTTYFYHILFERVNITDANVETLLNIPLYVPVQIEGQLPHYEYAGTLTEGGSFKIDDKINDGVGYFTAKVDYSRSDPISTTWEYLVEINLFNGDGTVNTELVASLNGQTLYTVEPSAEGVNTYTAVPVNAGFTPIAGTAYYTQNGARSYFAITDPSKPPYREAVTGERAYFKSVDAYRFVGNGTAGSVEYYSFTPNASKSEQYIKYSTVFYTGGYTNNEWFKRYVLDMDSKLDTFNIKVDSVTPDMLTEAMIKNSDLVVISAGLDLATGGSVAYTTDIKSKYYDEIILKPRVVDLTLSAGEGTKLNALKDGNSSSNVTAENVYYFAPATTVDGNKQTTALATNLFHTTFAGYTAANPNPYQVVVDEIEYENVLRSAAKQDPLSTDVSMATCLRYIINTHRTINKKTSLRVLDIQPVARYDGDTGPLTVANVVSWLPDSMQEQLKKADGTGHNITITHMSTNSLVGKLEDISEEYDLIYIGAATSEEDLAYLRAFIGSGTSGVGNEYQYSNIGALAAVDNRKLGGVLTSDGSMPSSADLIQTRYSGNDLTPEKQTELKEFAETGMPVVLASSLVNVVNPENAGQIKLSVSLENNGNVIKAVPKFEPGLEEDQYDTPTYQWKRWQKLTILGINLGWREDTSFSAKTQTITAQENYKYQCTMTVTLNNGETGTATSAQVSLTNVTITIDGRFETSGVWQNSEAYQGTEEFNESELLAGGRPTVKVTPVRVSDVKHIWTEYQWYQGTPGGTSTEVGGAWYSSSTASLEDNIWYYCKINVTYRWPIRTDTLISPAYRWVPPVTNTNIELRVLEEGEPGTIYNYGAGGNITLKNSAIDPCSRMYEVLSGVVERENVMAESQLTLSESSNFDEMAELRILQQKEILAKYLNLSRPSITFTGTPTEYGGNLSQLSSYDCEGYLNFEFKISNPTDATPIQTRYRCNLYIDQNGDGRHSADERIYDFQLKEVKADGTTVAVENNELQGQGQTYSLTRQLKKSQFSGLVAWKLEVVKVGDSTAHASGKGFAYIQPDEPTPIKVLQITNSNESNTANLATPYEAEGTEWELDPPNNMTAFQELYKEVYDAGMYDITVETRSVDSLNNLTDPFGELNNYEMIVLGFGDTYGNLEADAAQAVAQYIETGKSVLFTHDTTSIWNREKRSSDGLWDWLENMTNFRGYWGYHFNKIIRDKVGLDRYGVTNSTFQSMGVDSGTKRAISPEEVTALEDAGYTVAYVPGKVDKAAGETQGYSNLTVARYQMDAKDIEGNNFIDEFFNKLPIIGDIFRSIFGDGTPITTTTSAARVNKGHITEYPYTLGENLTIGTTHEQYYQLNMNAKDITVWYCLSGSNYQNFKNDATNTYYIYNRGNITYSGAGHSSLSAAEKKLFVNTMIAAYRAGNSAPTVEFKTAAGDNASMHLVPVEYSLGDTTKGQSLSGQQNIYFELQDTNLTSDKAVTVALYYEDLAPAEGVEGDPELSEEGAVAPVVKTASLGTIYRVDTGEAVVNTANLSSGILYRTAIPREILNYFADQNPENGLKLYLKAITTIKGVGTIPDIRYTGFDVLTMKKLGLLRLE